MNLDQERSAPYDHAKNITIGMGRQSVAMYAQPQDQHAAAESVLTLAAEYASTGADLTVLKVLDYPEVTA